jgi:hypothetical protein
MKLLNGESELNFSADACQPREVLDIDALIKGATQDLRREVEEDLSLMNVSQESFVNWVATFEAYIGAREVWSQELLGDLRREQQSSLLGH